MLSIIQLSLDAYRRCGWQTKSIKKEEMKQTHTIKRILNNHHCFLLEWAE